MSDDDDGDDWQWIEDEKIEGWDLGSQRGGGLSRGKSGRGRTDVEGGTRILYMYIYIYIYMRIHMPCLLISRFDFAFSPKSSCILHRK